MTSDVSLASRLSDYDQQRVENVCYEHTNQELDINAHVGSSRLKNKVDGQGIQHEEVKLKAHQEEVSKGDPLVLVQDWISASHQVPWNSVNQLVNWVTVHDESEWLSTHLLNSPYHHLIDMLPWPSCVIKIGMRWNGWLSTEEVLGCRCSNLKLLLLSFKDLLYLQVVVRLVLDHELLRDEDLIGLQLWVFSGNSTDLTPSILLVE